MSKEEVIKILEKNKLKYELNIKETTALGINGIESGLYMYSPPGTGVYVPKGSKVTIYIYE